MSAFLDRVVDCARTLNKRIVFPDGDDERVRVAAERLAREKVAVPILVSPTGGAVAGVGFVDPKASEKTEHYASLYHERRKSRGVTESEARRIAVQPLYFSSLMVTAGDADGMVGGASNTTAETVRAVIHCVGVKEGFQLISSFMILVHPEPRWGSRGVIFLADPAVVPDPSASQLAEIAIAAAENAQAVPLRSSPCGAAVFFHEGEWPSIPWWKRSSKPCGSSRRGRRSFSVDGELQADAALVESVGRSKAPGSPVAGRANVLIFPALDAANIGYKLAERLGGAQSLGPFLQGLNNPANDLSRGSSAADIYYTAAVTAVQGRGRRRPGRPDLAGILTTNLEQTGT